MRVHQMVPRLDAGDAVSNQALAIHRLVTMWGFESHIFANGMDEFGKRHASYDYNYREFMSSPEDLFIYHFSIYCGNYEMLLETRNRKVLIYHNITPARFYDNFYPEAAHLCRLGRDLLPRLAGCDLALGDSDFNRLELVEAGFDEDRTGVLPINPPLDKLDGVEGDEDFEAWLADGKVNFLFVGRVVPNKRVEDIVKLFYCYHRGVNARSRLVVVGSLLNTYYSALLSLVRKMGLEDEVFFLGKVSDSRLKSCYRRCHYYVSMSEHEGFCVPLLEAFHFDLPVLAYAAGAVPETMGGAGILFYDKDYPLLAELVDRMEKDRLLGDRVLTAQRERLTSFDGSIFTLSLRRHLERLLGLGEPDKPPVRTPSGEDESTIVREG
ncbi:MAG: glycosyltransferase [Actinomycetota bacterium]|nr:glycosyltransferase [Actinomycetota bacterium]